jgi:hypothetical protein
MADAPTCECIVDWTGWREGKDPMFCGKVAAWRYPAMGGGFMYLCLEHAKPHTKYAEPCYSGEPS